MAENRLQTQGRVSSMLSMHLVLATFVSDVKLFQLSALTPFFFVTQNKARQVVKVLMFFCCFWFAITMHLQFWLLFVPEVGGRHGKLRMAKSSRPERTFLTAILFSILRPGHTKTRVRVRVCFFSILQNRTTLRSPSRQRTSGVATTIE